MDQEMMKRVTDTLEKVCNFLYQEKITEAHSELVGVLGSLEQLIFQNSDETYQTNMRDKLMEALTAMENEDYVMLADILQYEIIPMLSE